MRKLVRQMHISYYRDKVDSYPDIKCGIWNSQHGDKKFVYINSGSRRAETRRADSPKGKELLRIKTECDECKRILFKLESEWINKYGEPCETIRINHYDNTHNRRLFDSLICGRNPYNKDYKLSYKDIMFNSNLELQFAKLMDDYGILYKYEPEITVFDGRNRYPDFVIYLPWLDLIILVEIYGLSEKTNYIATVRDRSYDYMMTGWEPGRSMLSLYHYDKEYILPEMIMEEIETVAVRNCLLRQQKAA